MDDDNLDHLLFAQREYQFSAEAQQAVLVRQHQATHPPAHDEFQRALSAWQENVLTLYADRVLPIDLATDS